MGRKKISAWERTQFTNPLFDTAPPLPFDGETYDPARDGVRLGRQLAAVFAVMQDYQWHTLEELAVRCRGSQTSVSARIRDLRKPKFGGRSVEAEHVGDGLWQYRLLPL